jgi:hypothetical protein
MDTLRKMEPTLLHIAQQTQITPKEITGLVKQPIRFRIQQSKKGLMKRKTKNTYLFVEFESEKSIGKI